MNGRPLSKRGSIAVGVLVAAVGVAIIAISVLAKPEGFHAPRWVVASIGGAFVFFGGWTAAIYAIGFDPANQQATLPSPGIQLAVFVPGLILFALPFHWVAFGRGPRQFSTTLALPFFAVRRAGGEATGRFFFGLGAVLVDAILIAAVVRLVKQLARKRDLSASDERPSSNGFRK